ncbi:MAG: peptidase M23, partial [Gammaproteobacteria bacterium]
KIKALARLQKTLREQEAALLALRKSQKRALQSLEAQRKKRQKLLAGLSQEIRSQAQVLARLKADERRLATLLNRLQGTAKDVPAAAAPFQERLCWPVSGKLAARFGQVRRSGLPWQGVLILAPEGQPVRAVARGRIVFADWLRGYGFLVIIDHGGNYMSLYGHNQRLVKKVGDFVEAGEVIAYVGKSGGRIRPGLYFEIRRRGKPVDPTRACRIKVSSPSGP